MFTEKTIIMKNMIICKIIMHFKRHKINYETLKIAEKNQKKVITE